MIALRCVVPDFCLRPVTLEHLRQHKNIHFSRNPLIVRVLADLGYLKEMGEGVPRIFQEMEHYGLHPPEFSARRISLHRHVAQYAHLRRNHAALAQPIPDGSDQHSSAAATGLRLLPRQDLLHRRV